MSLTVDSQLDSPLEARSDASGDGSAAVSAGGPQSFNRLVLEALERHGGATCFRIERGGRWRDVSYRHFRRQTLRLTLALREAGLAGERIAIWAPNSPEWMMTHMAVLFAGSTVVPLRHSMPWETVRAMLADCGARAVAASGTERLGHLVGPDRAFDLVLDLEESGVEGATTLAELVSTRLDDDVREGMADEAAEIAADVPASIYYASTRGDEPLGAVFDQGQRCAALRHMESWMHLDEDDLAYTALPWSYVPSLEATLHYLVSGVTNALSHSQELVFEEIQQVSPTVMLTIPNALERAYDEVIQVRIRKLPESSQAMFDWALATGRQLRAAGDEASQELRERYARADMTFFSSIRGDFGGRFRRFYCTGATLPRQLAESMRAIGMEPVNVYSVTEAGGFPAVNDGGTASIDACGPAAAGYELRIAKDGELLVRGDTVMRGYWKEGGAYGRHTFAADGWLRTGDYGRLDDDGVLFVTGRKGDTLILSTGRKVWPAEIEDKLKASPFVHDAAVFGESRPFVSALLVPDLEAIGEFLTTEDADDGTAPATAAASAAPDDASGPDLDVVLVPVAGTDRASSKVRWWSAPDESKLGFAHQVLEELFDQVVAKVNGQVDEWERIGRYALLGQEGAASSTELADDLAHDRGQLSQRWTEAIGAMYPTAQVHDERLITRVEVGPERLRELLEKESILDAWTGDAGIGFLFDLARTRRIDAPSVVHICDTAASVAQMEAEEKPLSTALIVGDPVRISRVLSPSLIQLRRHEHIRRMRNRLVDLAKLVDGLVLAYVVDRHGFVRGICRLDLEVPSAPKAVLGPQFRLHSEISRRCDAVVFFVPKGGRQVRVFAQGELVGRYSNGDWSPEVTGQVGEYLEKLTESRGYDPGLLRRLLRCAFRMSEENRGAIFLLGAADEILRRSDAPDISHFATLAGAPVGVLSDEELINFAQQDGATVIDADTGRFRGCMVLLRPEASTKAQVGPGKGARHSSAAKMSAETGALAITVSQDGPITLYDDGQRILSL